MSSDGTGLTPLSPALPSTVNFIDGFNGEGTFSPDGKLIAFKYEHGKVANNQLQFSDIWIMNADAASTGR